MTEKTVDDDGRTLCYERRGESILIGRLPEWVPRLAGIAKELRGEEGYLRKQVENE